MPIDLKVAGDENSCRTAADQLSNLGNGITDGGTAFQTVRSESETLWRGQAGDAFRDRMQQVGQKTDEIADSSRTAAQASQAFADDLSTVKSRMNQAREIASGAGLTVNGDTIEDDWGPAKWFIGCVSPMPQNGVRGGHRTDGTATAAYSRPDHPQAAGG